MRIARHVSISENAGTRGGVAGARAGRLRDNSPNWRRRDADEVIQAQAVKHFFSKVSNVAS